MILIVDLSKGKKKVSLVLKQGKKITASHQWAGLYRLSEMLLPEIDKFLKKNGFKLEDIGEIKIIPGSESMVGNRIAKAVGLGLKTKI